MEEIAQPTSGSGSSGGESQEGSDGEEDSLQGSDLHPPSPPPTAYGAAEKSGLLPPGSSEEGEELDQQEATTSSTSEGSLRSFEGQSEGVDEQEFSGDDSASLPESSHGSVNFQGMDVDPSVDDSWSAPSDVPLDLTGELSLIDVTSVFQAFSASKMPKLLVS